MNPKDTNQEADKPQPTEKQPQTAAQQEPDVMEVVQEQQQQPTTGNPAPSAPGFQDATLSPKIQRAIQQMREMGFSDTSGFFRDLLIRYDGDVEKVIRAVLEN